LFGLGTNASLGWWWADPVAALVIAAVAVRTAPGGVAGRRWRRLLLEGPHDHDPARRLSRFFASRAPLEKPQAYKQRMGWTFRS